MIMRYCFHHIPKTGGSTLKARLNHRASIGQIDKFSYAIGHNISVSTPGKHYTLLRNPLHRDISHFNYDFNKKENIANTFEESCNKMHGNFMVLWLYSTYLKQSTNIPIEEKYKQVQTILKNNFLKIFNADKFENSWKEITKILNIDVEPRLNSNISNIDYNKIAKYENLSNKFKKWHKQYNQYDYLLHEEFCT